MMYPSQDRQGCYLWQQPVAVMFVLIVIVQVGFIVNFLAVAFYMRGYLKLFHFMNASFLCWNDSVFSYVSAICVTAQCVLCTEGSRLKAESFYNRCLCQLINHRDKTSTLMQWRKIFQQSIRHLDVLFTLSFSTEVLQPMSLKNFNRTKEENSFKHLRSP